VFCAATLSAAPLPPAAPAQAQITVLYDAFGKSSDVHKDWGYSALVEYGGKRILFDTGNNPDILAHNAQVKQNLARMKPRTLRHWLQLMFG
jgi:7,8-dihydropterin-6-yl-methyl-4-(beta-D-ribofuranosyl)aminobenzene 5'-phosphate synthase